uniref:Retrovirus-related Pol polyprotein from transposon TNT 1-94 n=1 Tax=Tanacetum cinerariifolium TaxID=118510 RepID=A0A6L2KC11_TANCI|nr:hypothetical protein [Tanacetum cinerariifolium]
MNPIATQQAALDNALVPSEKKLKIKGCNARITFSKPQREETYQVTLEALKLSPCYPVFLITVEICLRILNQYFIAPPSKEDLVTFIQELGYSGRCNMLSAIQTDQMHQPWRTFVAILNRINIHIIHDDSLLNTLKFVSKIQDYQQYGALILDDMINQDIKDSEAYKTFNDFATVKVPPRKARKYKKVASPSRKLSLVKEAELVKKGKRVKRSAKKSNIMPTASVVIRDTPGLKSRRPYKKARKTIISLKQVAQVKELILNEGEDDNDDDSNDDSKGDDDKADSDDNGNSDSDDNERTDSDDDDDDDENPSFTLKDYNEEEHDEEYESDDDYENPFEEEDVDLYKEVDVRSLGAEHEKEREGDEEMTDIDQNVSHEKSYEQVIKDAHVTLTSSQKTKSSNKALMCHPTSLLMTPSPAPTTIPTTTLIPALPDFSSLFFIKESLPWKGSCLNSNKLTILHNSSNLSNLNPTMLDDLLSTRNGYATRIALEYYIKDFKKKAQEERKLYIDVVEKSVKEIIKDEVKKSLAEFELKKTLLDKMARSESYKTAPEHKELYEELVKSYKLDKDLFSSYGNMNKDVEPPKGSKTKESKTSSSKVTKSQTKSSGKSVQAEEPVFETVDTEMLQDQGGDTKDQPNVEATQMDDWFKKPNKPRSPNHPWNDRKSIDSRPPQNGLATLPKQNNLLARSTSL